MSDGMDCIPVKMEGCSMAYDGGPVTEEAIANDKMVEVDRIEKLNKFKAENKEFVERYNSDDDDFSEQVFIFTHASMDERQLSDDDYDPVELYAENNIRRVRSALGIPEEGYE